MVQGRGGYEVWYANLMMCGDGIVMIILECSRRRAKLEQEGRTVVTLHCTQNGNFEELQCDSGLCWCADEYSGNPLVGTTVVQESLWTLLPCCEYFDPLHDVKQFS